MRDKPTLRAWHAFWSILLALPIAIVALTAVFIAHTHELGLKHVAVAAGWLPGYAAAGDGELAEPRALLLAADGTVYVGTKGGLFSRVGDRLAAVPGLRGIEVRDLAVAPDGRLYAATRQGLWSIESGAWRRALDGEAWSVEARDDGTVVATLKQQNGIVVSRDGGTTWAPETTLNAALASIEMPAEPLTVHKLVMDLHTGKAFLGKRYEWLWIDAVGLAMLFLCASGLVIWVRTRRQKLRAVQVADQPVMVGTRR